MPKSPDSFEQRRRRPRQDPAERPSIPLPADVREDRDAEIAAHRQLHTWLDEAYEEFVQSGGFDNLPGMGKPLVVPTGDPFESMLKNANVQSPWILLRIETLKLLERAVHLAERNPGGGADDELDELIGHINKLIAEMNEAAPSLTLHRPKVHRATLREQFEKWK